MGGDAGHTLLREVWGFDSFRPGQEEIVRAVAEGRDVLAVMPTGGGKSLCFQLPALLRDGLTVVISPLIALMRDQVRALTAAGVEAGAYTSANTEEENEALREGLREGRIRLLYLAPERLAQAGTAAALRRWGASAIAVDEAHCVSQWGHDFRPDYLRIGALREALGVPLAAFTATADEETREEIVERLFGGREPKVFLRGFDRPNIHLGFALKDSPRKQVIDYAKRRQGRAGIVYCGTRAKTEVLAQALREAGLEAVAYHAGLEPDARRLAEERFQREDGLIVVATVAFGMGVDKPDIRWVMHADLPKSVEGYYQEIGRAGRDGLPAEALTLYGPEDIRLRRSQIDEGGAPEARKIADHGRLNALLGIAEATGCRRVALLGYFDEAAGPCGACDNCDRPAEVFDATTPARMVLSAALRTEERFGKGHLIDILLGEETDKVRSWRHDQLPTFGVGTEWDRRQWDAIVRQMLGQDLLRPDPGRHGALRLTENARPVLKGEQAVTMRRDVLPPKGKGATRAEPRAMVAEEDQGLLSALKSHRRALAQAQNVPAYVVFTDKTLMEMAEKRPATLDEMARIGGVGAKKLDTYGRSFLEVILGEAPAPVHPRRQKLAGREEGTLFDRLQAAQAELARGPDGRDKPLSLNASALARIAAQHPRDMAGIERIVGPRAAERFGATFLEILRDG
ncbi:DNA helicase RecQ [Rubellimicrobium aerolatum]|uniref:DNA helicase RecQ n=1 Tax=Rubellimicrobium aerolatum TaxID=490979 RepID=A0ABW0SHE9_9RHOB|nr:DNA helicase RecQ [Rubellimicrobium aerolatum]MBP1807560.1 ATP-dependent DNA helicase RecQ [Rubellimicrobium aerolatum]